MLNTVEDIAALLQGSFLAEREIQQLEIPESRECAFVISVPPDNALDAWTLMRSHLANTNRYPILTEGWGSDDYFSRFYYKEEADDGMIPGTAPEAIIASISTANLEDFLERREASTREFIEDLIDFSLEGTKERFGSCPDRSQVDRLIDNGTIQSTAALEKWLFDWELLNFRHEDAITASDTSYLDWFEPNSSKVPLVLLPTENSWDALAYMHWFAACTAGTTVAMSFLRMWHQKYQAELVGHYGTMLHLKVGRRPTTPEEAFELASQQEALAECTTILPGVSLREHARALLTVDRWFLHEKP